MALTVFGDILSLEREIGNLFQGLTSGAVQYPRMNISDAADEIVLVAELPGVRKEDIHLTFDNGLLTINGERKAAATPEKVDWLRSEIKTGDFSRVIALPRQVNADQISAELSNGILRVVLPKAEEAKPRDVRIK